MARIKGIRRKEEREAKRGGRENAQRKGRRRKRVNKEENSIFIITF